MEAKRVKLAKGDTLSVGEDCLEVIDPIASGTYGEVVVCECLSTQEQRAVKFITLKSNIEELELRAEFTREIEALETLDHHNIVQFLGCDPNIKIRGNHCMTIVEEFCENGELLEYIVETGRFEPSYAMVIFKQLCAGLKHMHDAGFAHRDLKPENLLFDKNFTLKICDFGSAKKFLDQHGRKRPMQTIVGTGAYIAPEVWRRKPQGYTEKVDIFAAGIILFTLLSGKMPFKLSKDSDLYASKLKDNQYNLFWKAHEKNMKFEEDAKSLIESMLNFNSRRRLNIDRVLRHCYMKIADSITKDEFHIEMNRRQEFMAKVRQEEVVKKEKLKRSNSLT